MSNYQSFLFSLAVVLQILLVCCSYTKEDFGIFAIGVTLVCSCTRHFPEKVERYILKHNILDDKGNGKLDLREALDIDYDTIYVFIHLLH